MQPEINIVWFKRDLRLADHEPLLLATQSAFPTLLIYCFEPYVMANADSDVRQWRFVHQSLMDIQNKLDTIGAIYWVVVKQNGNVVYRNKWIKE